MQDSRWIKKGNIDGMTGVLELEFGFICHLQVAARRMYVVAFNLELTRRPRCEFDWRCYCWLS